MTSTTTEAVQRYPLAWPIGWPRTPAPKRRAGAFSEKEERIASDGRRFSRSKAVTMPTAVDRLERQLEVLGGQDPTLSTNVRLNLRGLPYGNEQPMDPGAAVYFRFKAKATVLACDTYQRLADNIAALAAHIDALRRIDRYGVGSLEQALAGYRALPADSAANWRTVFGFDPDERVSAEALNSRFKEQARDAHPDRGGTDEGMAHLNRAREFALEELLS